MNQQEDGKSGTAWKAVGSHAGLGLTWALSTLLFLWLGSRVDLWLDTVPLFTIVGAFIGAGAGFYSIYRQVMGDSSKGEDSSA